MGYKITFKGKVWSIIILVTIIFWSFILSGCKAKRIEHTISKTDTIISNTVLKIREPQLANLVIYEPCDSLGQLKPFIFTYGNDNDKKIVKSIDNKLVIIDDKKADTTKTVEKEKISITEEKEVIIKYKVPKWCWYNLIYSILATLFIFRKPLFRLIKPI